MNYATQIFNSHAFKRNKLGRGPSHFRTTHIYSPVSILTRIVIIKNGSFHQTYLALWQLWLFFPHTWKHPLEIKRVAPLRINISHRRSCKSGATRWSMNKNALDSELDHHLAPLYHLNATKWWERNRSERRGYYTLERGLKMLSAE